jgi:hypothetical protein
MTLAIPNRESSHHDDLNRVLADIERRLVLDQAPPALPPAPLVDEPVAEVEPVVDSVTSDRADVVGPVDDGQAVNDDDTEPADDEVDDDEFVEGELVPLEGGETRQVRRERRKLAESHQLAVLQADQTPLMLESKKLRKRRQAAIEAARLHTLEQDPAMLAYTAAKARRRVNTALTVALVLALGWSTAGVQAFASDGAEPWTAGWVFAWFVEPFMSIVLLAFVGAKAFFATRGQPTHDDVLKRIEYLMLALTLGMNAWPYLPWSLREGEPFSFSVLVLHLVGPIVAYIVVTGWPRLLDRFATLDHGLGDSAQNHDRVTPLTAVSYSANATQRQDHRKGFGGVRNGLSEGQHRQRAHHMVATGQLPAKPSARQIQRALNCATDTASRLRDEFAAIKGAAS